MTHLVTDFDYQFPRKHVERCREFGFTIPTTHGVAVYDEEYNSVDGADFYLIKEDHVTNDMIAQAKRYLHQNRDALHIRIAYVTPEKEQE